jgi:glucose-6-phosphate 1-dehydrogenase
VETYAAVRLQLDTWRWEGVPFFIRAGKYLPVRATEVMVRFEQPPQAVFGRSDRGAPNHLRYRLAPSVEMGLGVRVKMAGEAMVGRDDELTFCRTAGDEMKPYERLLGDALRGDATLFAREDEIEAAWRVVDPGLDRATPVHAYEQRTWGPHEADRIIGEGGWHDPR